MPVQIFSQPHLFATKLGECYCKTWRFMYNISTIHRLHRQDIRIFATESRTSPSGFKSPLRLHRVIALFIETGVLYVVFFIRFKTLLVSIPSKLTSALLATQDDIYIWCLQQNSARPSVWLSMG